MHYIDHNEKLILFLLRSIVSICRNETNFLFYPDCIERISHNENIDLQDLNGRFDIFHKKNDFQN